MLSSIWGRYAGLVAISTILGLSACSKAGEDHASKDMAGHDMADMEARPLDTSVTVPDYADNFRLVDHTGVAHELHYYTDAPAIVLVSHGNGCPIVRNAMPELESIAADYADKGVKVFLVNSNLQDSRDDIIAEAAEYGVDLPILIDETQLIGEHLGVQRTAQVFVIDPAAGFQIVYSGPMDDRLSYERQKSEPENTFLRDALTQLVAGEEVTVEPPPLSPGCLVNFPQRDARAQHANISYANDVAPILMDKCVACHTEGGIGPWSMDDYQTVQGWAPMMREVIRTDRMPPWHADPHIGSFMGDRSLTNDEIKTLVHWIEAGAPRGEGEDPLVEAHFVAPEWPFGEPDLVLTLPAFDVPETGIVDYQYPFVENPLTEDKWIKATAVKVGSRETVHHVLSGYMSTAPADGQGETSRWEFATGGYAVGAETTVQAEDSGIPLPAGGGIGFQMHYTPVGKAVTDVTEIGFYFHDETPELLNRSSVILDASIEIPPGEGAHKETAYVQFPHDAILTSVFPHAHYRGKATDVRLRYPDGREEMLVSLPFYDFNWQRAYIFETPIDVPAGSMLIADYVYDNSDNNRANPDSSVNVTWGEQSHEEMLYTSFSYRWKGETTANLNEEATKQLDASRFFFAMDDNIDGNLEEAELRGMLGQRLAPAYPFMDQDKDGRVTVEEFGNAMAFIRRQSGQQ